MSIEIGKNVYVAETAILIGDVKLSDGVSVFDHTVLRGDMAPITVGKNSNIQDNVTIHCDMDHPSVIGENVSIGHNAVVHGARVDDSVIIGMGSIVLNGSHIKSGCVVAAGAVVKEDFSSPENSLLAGIPAEVKKTDSTVKEYTIANSLSYQHLRDRYLAKSIEKRAGGDRSIY